MSIIDVLHIGDNRQISQLVESSVGGHPGFRVRRARSGDEALTITKDWSPAVILLDANTPGTDRSSTLPRLRQQPKTADVPVIVLAADQAPGLANLNTNGVAGVIGKPFDTTALWPQIIDILLTRLRTLETANRDLAEQLTRADAVSDCADSGIVILDDDGIVLRFNPAAERMSHFRANEVIGRNYLDIIPSDQVAHDAELLARVRTGETVRFETRQLQRDGSEVEVSLKLSPIRDCAGTIIGAVSITQNIEDRRAIEAALASSQARHDQVIRAMSVGVWDRDIASGQSFWSDRMKDMLGLPPDFVPSPYEFEARLHPDDREPVSSALRRHLQTREPYEVEYRIRKADGSYAWQHATAQAAWDTDGKAIRIVGSIADISARKAAETELRELNESLEAQVAAKSAKLQTIVDALPSLIAYWDTDLRCCFANAAYLEWFGRGSQQMVGIDLRTLLGDELFCANEHYIRGALSGVPQHFRRELTRTDGSIRQTWANYVPHRDSGGEVAGFFVIVTDVTPMVEADARVAESEARYRLLAENTTDIIFHIDRDLVRRYVSPACQDMLGYEAKDLTGVRAFGLLHSDDTDQWRTASLSVLGGELARASLTGRFRHRDGHWIWVEVAMRGLRDPETGQITGLVGAIRDTSARKALEEEMKQRSIQLEAANQELDAFAYAASHDLKAPLRVIDKASKWLEKDLDPHLDHESRANLKLLRSRVVRLDRLLDDLLRFSRIGREPGGTEIIKASELVSNVLELLSPPDGFVVRVDPGFAEIEVARMPLQQILLNLVSNAIKHHDKPCGQIDLTVENRGAHQVFAFRDDGPGIPARFHEVLPCSGRSNPATRWKAAVWAWRWCASRSSFPAARLGWCQPKARAAHFT